MRGARTEMVDLENLPDAEIEAMHQEFKLCKEKLRVINYLTIIKTCATNIKMAPQIRSTDKKSGG